MSLRFLKHIVATGKVGEDTIKFNCRPMSRADALKLWSNEDEEGVNPNDTLDIFNGYVDSVEGAVAEDGSALDKDVVLNAAFFTGAVAAAALEWARMSMPEDQRKKVKGSEQPKGN